MQARMNNPSGITSKRKTMRPVQGRFLFRQVSQMFGQLLASNHFSFCNRFLLGVPSCLGRAIRYKSGHALPIAIGTHALRAFRFYPSRKLTILKYGQLQ